MIAVLAWLTFLAVAVMYLRDLSGAVTSIRDPSRRSWPPPESEHRSPLRMRVHSLVTALAVPVVGLLDWNSFVFDHPSRFVVAALLIASGAYAGSAHRHLGTEESVGQPPPGGDFTLRTDGPYAITRNPQYTGSFPVYFGVAIGTNSLLALVAAALMCTTLVVMVLAEESWLRERFGDEYDRYCQRVPRFVPHALNPFR